MHFVVDEVRYEGFGKWGAVELKKEGVFVVLVVDRRQIDGQRKGTDAMMSTHIFGRHRGSSV